MIEALFYKLRMFGVPIEGECCVFEDNEGVVKAGSNPDARLSKKHDSVVYHQIREYVAFRLILLCYEKGESNLADLLIKSLPVERRVKLLKGIMN